MSTKRSLFPGTAVGWAVRSIAALAVALGLLARPADATLAVYASDDGVYRGVQQLDTEAIDDVVIWIDKVGTTPSADPCNDEEGQGEGDEICGYDVLIEIQGPGCFTGSFTAGTPGNGPVVYHPTGDLDCDTKQLHAALVNTGATSTDPQHIVTVKVDAPEAAESTKVLVLGRSVVAANLALESIPQDTIAATPVPEPAEILLLASAIAGLAWLHRLRKGSPSAR